MFQVRQLEHMIKDYLKLIKVKQDLQKKDNFVIKANATKLGPTLIALNYKVKTNVFFNFLDSKATCSFMRMSVIE
jgi:hypothetical protein